MIAASFALTIAFAALRPAPLPAQSAPSNPSQPAEAVAPVVAQLFAMRPEPGRVAQVSNLVLERDAARFELGEGRIQLLSSVQGRTVGLVWSGRGTFTLAPTLGVERWRLRRIYDADTLRLTVTEAVFLFTDATLAELERKLTFGPGGDVEDDRVPRMLKWLGDESHQDFDPDFLESLLNGTSPGAFYAYLHRAMGDPVVYRYNPHAAEEVSLEARLNVGVVAEVSEQVVSFPAGGRVPGAGWSDLERHQAVIEHYDLDVHLPRTAGGDVNFSATGKLRIMARDRIGPWVAFHLFPGMTVDSARWESGGPAITFKGKDSPVLWVRLDRALDQGETRTLVLGYHGDLIDRFGDFHFMETSSYWYPRPLEGRSRATFDLTYHTPASFAFASVGELVDSSVTDRVVTTRWRARSPIRNASFNLGMFSLYSPAPAKPGDPPVSVLWAEKGHRDLPFARDRNMKERVGDDVTQSLAYFAHHFGPPPVDRFYATEIPYGHGEAFPGLVHLSWVTFQQQGRQGEDEFFRAHEVAHQWWGIAVDYASYRDRWLSEGFASFSGLWYVQAGKDGVKKYFDELRTYRDGIFSRGDALGPIWLGHRIALARDGADYSRAVYEKGAWVLHMVRAMLIDLKTMNEDRFTALMREYYAAHQGRAATTADFQRILEQQIGQPMQWFFDQWVYGNELPTYRVAEKVEPVGDGQYRVTLQVEQKGVPAEFRAYVPVTIPLEDGRQARFRVHVTGAKSEIVLPGTLPAKPKEVKFNDLEGVLAKVEKTSWK